MAKIDQHLKLRNDGTTEMFLKTKCSHPLIINGCVVRCGQCPECLKMRREEWCWRMENERLIETCIDCQFTTLTYKNEFLPVFDLKYKKVKYWNMPNGLNVRNFPRYHATLVPHHLRDYLHAVKDKMRYTYGDDVCVRQYAVGEYGGNGMRPHYHIVYFLHYFGDLSDNNKSKIDSIRKDFRKIVVDLWKYCDIIYKLNDRLHIYEPKCKNTITVTGPKEILYVAKYVNKRDLANNGCIASSWSPEFCIISRSNKKFNLPCVGESYIYEHMEKFQSLISRCMYTGEIFNPTYTHNGFTKPLPRTFYLRLLRIYDGYNTTGLNIVRKAISNFEEQNRLPKRRIYRSCGLGTFLRKYQLLPATDKVIRTAVKVCVPHISIKYDRFIKRDLGLLKEYVTLHRGNTDDYIITYREIERYFRSASYNLPKRKLQHYLDILSKGDEFIGWYDNGKLIFDTESPLSCSYAERYANKLLTAEHHLQDCIDAKLAHDDSYYFEY